MPKHNENGTASQEKCSLNYRLVSKYDRTATIGLAFCSVDRSLWVPSGYGATRECPEGQDIRTQFPEALARRLVEFGYLLPEDTRQIGIDMERIDADRAAATNRYAEQMVSGWFVVARTEQCMLSRNPASPAAMISEARARGVEDSVTLLEAGGDGKPVVVRVDEPKGNGLVAAVIFYRGAAKCEFWRDQQKRQLENLR